MQIVIEIPEESYRLLQNKGVDWLGAEHILTAVANGIPLPKADNKYEAKVITSGNCMMCGKELTEGLFFCKECENKGKRVIQNDK